MKTIEIVACICLIPRYWTLSSNLKNELHVVVISNGQEIIYHPPMPVKPLPMSVNELATLSIDDTHNQKSAPFVIGIAGGTASGKTNVVNSIVTELGHLSIVYIAADNFYKTVPKEIDASTYNFDAPEAIDSEYMAQCIKDLVQRKSVQLPVYDFVFHERRPETILTNPGDVIVVEGLMVLFETCIRELLNLKLFVDTDSDLRLLRRIRRDMAERGRTIEDILYQYETFVKPGHDEIILPSKRYADLIVPYWPNPVAFDVIVQHVKEKLRRHDLSLQLPHVRIIKTSPQIQRIQSLLKQADVTQSRFVSISDRLAHLVIENALEWLHLKHDGERSNLKICAISLIPAGAALERTFQAICPEAPVGKLLIQPMTKSENQYDVVFSRLPAQLRDYSILILDPILGRGNRITQAITHLMNNQAQPGRIILTCLLGTMFGLDVLGKRFPGIRIVTSEVDTHPTANESSWSRLENFGDKYFGTQSSSRQADEVHSV